MPPSPQRLFYIDNLRWTAIVLVVSMHAAVTYSGVGSWYYIDRTNLTLPVLFAFVTYQSFLQAFFMALLFFLAGYFVPAAYRRKGPARFLRDRAHRLGWPVLFYMFVLGPLTEYFVAHSWRSRPPASFASEWLHHIRNGEFLSESGPLWFCLALLIFSALYTLFPKSLALPTPFPTPAGIWLFVALMSLSTFAVRLVQPAGSSFFNLQLANFSQYVAAFLAGIAAYHRGWLENFPCRSGLRWLTVALAGGFASWIVLLWTGGAFSGQAASYGGGLHWQAAAFDIWESFVCLGICLGLLVIFREHFNRQNRVSRFLSDNAFSVYVFHPPILIALALSLHHLPWPAPLKFAVLTALAVLLTYIASWAVFRRLPGLRSIL